MSQLMEGNSGQCGPPLGVSAFSPLFCDGEAKNSEIAFTTDRANRLIGDEQAPPDIVWEMGDRILKDGNFMKELPDWFVKNEARPFKARYTFTAWNYFHNRDTYLLPSGLLGSIKVALQTEDL